MTRALSTEVTVDTADFDTYHVPSPPSSSSSSSSGVRVVTFAQKEFKVSFLPSLTSASANEKKRKKTSKTN